MGVCVCVRVSGWVSDESEDSKDEEVRENERRRLRTSGKREIEEYFVNMERGTEREKKRAREKCS